jgi:hypothetical protein
MPVTAKMRRTAAAQMRPEKLDAWRALRERYGNRDESRVDRGALLAPAA